MVDTYVMWNQALNEYNAAKCMFDYAISDSHINIAISAMYIAEKKLEMIRELAILNKKYQDDDIVIEETNKIKIFINDIKSKINNIKRMVKKLYV